MPPKGKAQPPTRTKGRVSPVQVAGVAAAAGVGAAAGVVATTATAHVADEEEEGQELEGEEEEEEDDSADACFQMMISFGPLIYTIVAEFAGAAFEAGICQYLALALLPLWNGLMALFGMANAPPAPPAFAPPAPPPPPIAPDLVTVISASVFTFAAEWPVTYLLIDFNLAILVGVFFLYLKDINAYLEARRIRQQQQQQRDQEREKRERLKELTPAKDLPPPAGYVQLHDDDIETGVGGGGDGDGDAPADEDDEEAPHEVLNVPELQRELRVAIDKVEELDIKLRVHRKAPVSWVDGLREERRSLIERRDELEQLVGDKKAEATSAPEAAPAADDALKGAARSPGSPLERQGTLGEPSFSKAKVAALTSKPKKKKAPPKPVVDPKAGRAAAGMLAKILKGPIVGVLMRTFTGVMAIWLYFADVISDVLVIQLYLDSKNWVWAGVSIFLLVAQFVFVYCRVLPYFGTNFGYDSTLFYSFLFGGMPFGLLFLDMLMFLEPFGLLPVIPFPAWLKAFIPAYKATRVIAEVVIESLPQAIVQAYTYVIVIKACGPTAPPDAVCLDRCAPLRPRPCRAHPPCIARRTHARLAAVWWQVYGDVGLVRDSS